LEMIERSAVAVLRPGLSVAVSGDRAGIGAGEESGPPATATVTLTAGPGIGKRASRRLRLTPGRRSVLLSLSRCLAECAMDLGLGASVCRPGTSPSTAFLAMTRDWSERQRGLREAGARAWTETP